MTGPEILSLLSSARFSLTNEKETQRQIFEHLSSKLDCPIEREVRLSPHNIADIMVGGGWLIEVKIKRASKMSIFNQLKRYAHFGKVCGVILVTGVPLGLPKEINGKPLYYHSLGKSWL